MDSARDRQRAQSEVVASAINSLEAADNNLEEMIDKICQRKWEQEVIEKKGKPHAIEWVFSQAQDCYFQKPDPNKS